METQVNVQKKYFQLKVIPNIIISPQTSASKTLNQETAVPQLIAGIMTEIYQIVLFSPILVVREIQITSFPVKIAWLLVKVKISTIYQFAIK